MVNEINYFGYCGKNCISCEYNINSKCQGCKITSTKNENEKVSKECHNCNIKFCAEKKGISFCFLCPKFPCQYFSFFSQDDIAKLYEQKTIICNTDQPVNEKQ